MRNYSHVMRSMIQRSSCRGTSSLKNSATSGELFPLPDASPAGISVFFPDTAGRQYHGQQLHISSASCVSIQSFRPRPSLFFCKGPYLPKMINIMNILPFYKNLLSFFPIAAAIFFISCFLLRIPSFFPLYLMFHAFEYQIII